MSRTNKPRAKAAVSFVLPKQLDDRIADLARMRMTTKSAVIRELLAGALSAPVIPGR